MTTIGFPRRPVLAGLSHTAIRRDVGELFDAEWYLQRYADVAAAGIDPLGHYLKYGAAEGRDPHPLFWTEWYLRQHAGALPEGQNPLVHFVREGGRSGRDPNPLFCSAWYLDRYPDARASSLNPLLHYLRVGASLGHDPGPEFDTSWYLEQNPDVRDSAINPLVHYVLYGEQEGRPPSRSGPPVTFVNPSKALHPYQQWLQRNRPTPVATRELQSALAAREGRLPLISVVMPVYDTDEAFLRAAIDSVVRQIHPDWQLCICDDGSTAPHVAPLLASYAAADSRISIVTQPVNLGIAGATNAAAALASGEFLAFLDHDDVLAEDALAEIAIAAADDARADIIYSDNDKISVDGDRYDPHFKPDWSPVLLLSHMYLSHLFVVRRALFDAVGGCRRGYEGSQDYDLALRVSERADRVRHIPKVLYSWRAAPQSLASSAATKPHSIAAGLRAVSDAFSRRGFTGTVSEHVWADGRFGLYRPDFPDDGPSVTILIPTRNRLDLVRPCIESLRRTTYSNYRIVVIDNESDDPALLAYLRAADVEVLRVASNGAPFSFAAINNRAAAACTSDFVLFLNNDTEVVEPRWLSQMMGYAGLPGVGAVGARLLYPDGTVQHAGIVNGYHFGAAGHAFRGMDGEAPGYQWSLKVARECAGVTAACMLTPTRLFLGSGGFDEERFAVAYNDVDYCNRLSDSGYSAIYCPDAILTHHESQSRGIVDRPEELAALRRLYGSRVDPYYNPNLSLADESFRIQPYRHPPPDIRPVRVAAVTHNLNYEGAPLCQLELLAGLRQRGIIEPLVLSPADGPLRAAYEAEGIGVEIIPAIGIRSEEAFAGSTEELGSLYKARGAELVYANTLQTFWALAAAETAGIPALWHIHESEPWDSYFSFLRGPVRDIAYRMFLYPYRNIFVSAATERQWRPTNAANNAVVLHHALAPERIAQMRAAYPRQEARDTLGLTDEDIAVVLLGTVTERKGQIDLVDAFAALPEDAAAQAVVFIVGDRPSPYSERLHRTVDALPDALRARVRIISETPQPHLYLAAADVAVCCSRVESYPRVILEAMAFGLPLVTTQVFGIAEQVRPDCNALVYEPGDTDTLATQLAALIGDEVLRRRLGSNALAVLASLPGFDEMMAGYASLFRQAYGSSCPDRS